MDYPTTCLICEKPVELIPNMEGDDSKGYAPNFVGGDIQITFGYGSQFDMIGALKESIQAVICDDCFRAKQHLTRTIQIIESKKWISVDKKY